MRHEHPVRRALDSAAWSRHAGAITVVMNMMFVRHLIGVYREFDGDLVEAIVLGEIAHHNLSSLVTRARSPLELSEALRSAGDRLQDLLLPTNSFSIAQAVGIPRETVRRKVTRLARRGWIVKDAAGNLFVAPAAGRAFADFHAERLIDLLRAARSIEMLLGDHEADRGGVGRIAGERSPSAPGPSTP